MEGVLAIKDIRASRVPNVTMNIMNLFVTKPNYYVHTVIMLVMLVDAIRLVRKVVGSVNVVGPCNQNLVDVLTSMNAQPIKILVPKTNFV